jgi:hypothetical protein
MTSIARRLWWLGLVAALMIGQPGDRRPVEAASADESQVESVARQFVAALVVRDNRVLDRLSPTEPRNLFGPCMFKAMPTFSKPRVNGHKGGLDFEGKAIFSDLADKGVIAFTKMDDETPVWRVRQFFWYEKPPLGANVPDRSPTAADRKQEKYLDDAARVFIGAWLKGDYQTMERYYYDWVRHKPKNPPRGIKLRSISADAKRLPNGEYRVDFTASLTVYTVVPRTVSGILFAVKEGGQWKMRATTFSF